MNKIMYKGQIIVDFDELADKYTKAEIDAKMKNLFVYKGTVANIDSLNAIQEKNIGDCYNVASNGNNYAWNGTEWDSLSGIVDLSNYYDKSQVDALIAGIPAPDLSNYYNKTEANAKIDEKIAAIPVGDLLHYKGHVSSKLGLPSLGQSTGNLDSPNYSLKSIWTKYSGTTGINSNDILFYKNYYILYGYSNSLNYYDGLLTDYPEMIQLNFYKIDGTHELPLFKVTYDKDKPVYIYNRSNNKGYCVFSEVYYEGDNLVKATPVTSGNNMNFTSYKNDTYELITKTCYIIAGMPANNQTVYDLTNNMNIITNMANIIMFHDFDTCVADSYKWQGYDVAEHSCTPAKSLVNPDDSTYYYNAGMSIFSGEATLYNESYYKYVNKYTNVETETKLGDTYTVGDNYDIYFRNELVKWERWSKTENIVDNSPTYMYTSEITPTLDDNNFKAIIEKIYNDIESNKVPELQLKIADNTEISGLYTYDASKDIIISTKHEYYLVSKDKSYVTEGGMWTANKGAPIKCNWTYLCLSKTLETDTLEATIQNESEETIHVLVNDSSATSTIPKNEYYTPVNPMDPVPKHYVDTSIEDFKYDFLNNMQFKNTSEFLTEAGEFNYSLLHETFPQGGFLFNESYITISGVNIQANSIMQVSLWFDTITITLSGLGEMIQFVVTSDSCMAFRFTGTEVTLQ